MLFDIYVGSTNTHRAHSHTDTVLGIIHLVTREEPKQLHTYGVWEDELEPTTRYTVDLENDTQAELVAYAIAVETGNNAVLVSRLATRRDDSPMMSNRAYLTNIETTDSGDRTLYSKTFPTGYRYTPDIRGSHVAKLIHSNATITPVS